MVFQGDGIEIAVDLNVDGKPLFLSSFSLTSSTEYARTLAAGGIFDVARMGPFRRINTLRGSPASHR